MTAVLFDLDGTLVDTAPDLGLALNMQLELHGLPPILAERIRSVASHGTNALLKLGFNLTPTDAAYIGMRDEYLSIYDQVLACSPVLFDGVAELLAHIENKHIPWGIVTNKPKRFTVPMMRAMSLDKRAACVISGDDAARAKPYPDTLFMACQAMYQSAKDCIYVGDAQRDIEAGNAAGMRTVAALYGYLGEADKPNEWGADFMIHHPHEIRDLIKS